MNKFESFTLVVKGLVVAAIVVALTAPLDAATYYTDATNGRDSHNGQSEASAWKSIGKVNSSTFAPGDQILFKRGEVWREQLVPPSSGSATAAITFGPYGVGTPPVFNGAELISKWESEMLDGSPVYTATIKREPKQLFENTQRLRRVPKRNEVTLGAWWWNPSSHKIHLRTSNGTHPSRFLVEASQRNSGITIQNKHHLILNELETQRANFVGILLTGGSTHVVVDNCRTFYNYQDGIKGWDKARDQATITIRRCTVAYNGQDGIAVHQHDSGWVIEGNLVHHNCLLSDFEWSAGIKLLSVTVRNITVQNNTVYANGTDASAYRGKGIWVDTAGTGIIVRRNRIFNNSTNGLEIENSSGVLAAYNIIYNHPARFGIYVKAGKGFPASQNKIYNNTVYRAHIGLKCEGTASTESFVDNEIKNNIIVGSSTQLRVWGGAENDGVNGRGNVYTHNCLGPEFPSFIEWPAGIFLSTYRSWSVVYRSDTFSIKADPQFSDPAAGDFTLKSNSLCIDAGTDVSLSEDFLGTPVPQGSTVDVGAYEHR